MMPTRTDPPGGWVTLPPVQDIKSCAALADALAGKLKAEGVAMIDASAFVSGDITFVQALVAARKSAEALGATVMIGRSNAAVAALFERCGIEAGTRALHVPEPLEDFP